MKQDSRGRRVCHITTVHPWRDTRILIRECASLSEAGYLVDLVVADHRAPRTYGGVRIRVVTGARSRFQRVFAVAHRAVGMAVRQNPDIIHVHDPELLPWLPRLRRGGARVVYDAHEDLAEQVLSKDWIPRQLRGLASTAVGAMVPRLLRQADAVVAATPYILERLPARRAVLVRNYPLLDELLPAADAPYNARPPHVSYVGGVSDIRGALKMARAAALIAKPGFRMRIAGPVSPVSLVGKIRNLAPTDAIELEGILDRSEVASLLKQSRAGLVILQPISNYVRALPTKLFEYMAAGIPVIASDFPGWRQIVEGARCGLLVDPTDPTSIADAITWILNHSDEAEAMGRRGRQSVEERYNWQQESQSLLNLYEDLLA